MVLKTPALSRRIPAWLFVSTALCCQPVSAQSSGPGQSRDSLEQTDANGRLIPRQKVPRQDIRPPLSGNATERTDLPPPNMNNFVRGDERVTNLSERDSFLYPLKALKAKTKDESKVEKTPDKSEQTYVSAKVQSMQ